MEVNLLPFLKKRQETGISGIIQKTREPDETSETADQPDSKAAIKSAAKALIEAIHSRNVDGVADAIQNAFDIADSLPHEEGPHINEEQE